MTKPSRGPDWRHWLAFPAVKLWEACALSLNVDPYDLQRRDFSVSPQMAKELALSPGANKGIPPFEGFPSPEARDEFPKRLRLLVSCIGQAGLLFLSEHHEKVEWSVGPQEFARWAIDVAHWKLPAGLFRLAGETVRTEASAQKGAVSQRAVPPSKSKDTRSTAIDAVIEDARHAARNRDDPQQCWAQLVSIADSKNRPAPLLGYADSDGVKYQGEHGVKFLNKFAFYKRLSRKLAKERAR